MSGGVQRNEQMNYSELEKSKVVTNSQDVDDGRVFNLELTVSQANAISRMLPKSYTMLIDKVLRTKRVVKRTFTLSSKSYKTFDSFEEPSLQHMVSQPIYEQKQTSSYDQMVKKCYKILNLLRKNKNSWPFKEPVDPIALGIPNYKDIIQFPMDLRTVEQNLSSSQYSTISQFYADIQLIITNSFTFNQNNPDYCALTSEFEKYFNKLKLEPLSSTNLSIKKLPSKTSLPKQKPIDMKERKELVLRLKYLPKEELVELFAKITDPAEKNTQVNLETMAPEKIRFLQDYLAKKDASKSSKVLQQPVKSAKDGDESSFQSDSDE